MGKRKPKYGKVVRDGKVAILISPGWGAGWSTWADGDAELDCLYDPEVVAMVEAGKTPTDEWCKARYGEYFYSGGARNLVVMWVEEGSRFKVEEYDGFESLKEPNDIDWSRA